MSCFGCMSYAELLRLTHSQAAHFVLLYGRINGDFECHEYRIAFYPYFWLALSWPLGLCHRSSPYPVRSRHCHGFAHRLYLRLVWCDYNRVSELSTAGGRGTCPPEFKEI